MQRRMWEIGLYVPGMHLEPGGVSLLIREAQSWNPAFKALQ